MEPPVPDQVTASGLELPSLQSPVAENCCASPAGTSAVAGAMRTLVRVTACPVMPTAADAVSTPPCVVAVTCQFPSAIPAV